MKIFLTGTTGYVGQRILKDLTAGNFEVRALIRSGSKSKISKELSDKVEIVEGSVTDYKSINGKLDGCQAVIYLPGLIREFPQKGITFEGIHFIGAKYFIDEAKKSNIKRFILMSANGVRQDASTKYLRTKYQAEEYLKKSDLEWTIFRPSVIFGDENLGKENFFTVIRNLVNQLPVFIPIIGNGKYRFQPVSIQNLSEAFIKCLDMPQTFGKIYHLCGKEMFEYNELVDIVAGVLNVKKKKLHIPVFKFKFLAGLFGKYKWFPITNDQITMLLEENVCPKGSDFFDEFQINPGNLRSTITKTLIN